MTESIEPIRNPQGQIEAFAASAHLADAVTENFTRRGTEAARLVVATLTETPYTPTIDGTHFELEVSNRYSGYGDDEAATKDTVDIAHDALHEFIDASVPGTRRVHLQYLKTGYKGLLDHVRPGWRDTKAYRDAFDEALVEGSRRLGVEVTSPEQAIAIIQQAPRGIVGLRLSSRDTSGVSSRISAHKMVTEDGRIVTVHATHGLMTEVAKYFMPRKISDRGGAAPGSRIASEIEDRVVSLRTGHTKR